MARAADLVTGYRLIKGLRAETEATSRYQQASQQALGAALRTSDALGRFLAGSGSVSGVFVVAVAALAGWLAVHDQLTVGGLITAVGLAQALLPQMQFITRNAIPAAAAASASAARVLDVLKACSPAVREYAVADTEAAGVPVVDVLINSQVTVTVAPGELVGVRADERTAVRIIDAAVDPYAVSEVRLLFDNLPAEQLEPGRYRSHVTVSPHHPMLFSGTVADNLSLPNMKGGWKQAGAPGPTEAALRAAACEDFINIKYRGAGRPYR